MIKIIASLATILIYLVALPSTLSFASHFIASQQGELTPAHNKWLEEVAYIITDKERKIFNQLTSSTMRDRFIKDFWERRDPTPWTPANEFKEEYYRRIQYADEIFGRGTPVPGWKTDRGRIYILLGPPDNRSRHPGSRFFYPLEIWQYNSAPSAQVKYQFRLIFFKRWGVGDYYLYSPTLDGLRSLLIQSQSSRFLYSDQLSRELLLRKLPATEHEIVEAATNPALGLTQAGSEALLAQIQKPPPIDEDALDELLYRYNVNTEIFYNLLPFSWSSSFYKNNIAGSYMDCIIEITPDNLTFRKTADKYYFGLQVYGEIKDFEDKLVDSFNERIDFAFSEDEFNKNKNFPFQYQKRLILLPGHYTISLFLRSLIDNYIGTQEHTFSVPSFQTNKIEMSDLILSYRVEKQELIKDGPYIFSDIKVLPCLNNELRKGTNPFIIYKIYYPAPDSSAQWPAFQAEYEIWQGDEIVDKIERFLLSPQNYAPGELTIANQLALEHLPEGDYSLRAKVFDPDGNLAVFKALPFSISDKFQLLGRISAVSAQDLTAPYIHYKLGKQYFTRGQITEAKHHLDRAVKSNPNLIDAKVILSKVLIFEKEFAIARDILEGVLAQEPENYDALITLANAYSKLNDFKKAIELLQKSRKLKQDSYIILNALAQLYLNTGDEDKAKELLLQSLKLNPNQPEIRKFLKEKQNSS